MSRVLLEFFNLPDQIKDRIFENYLAIISKLQELN